MTTPNQPQPTSGPGHPGAPGHFPSFSTVNFYAGNRLSRFSWKRNDSSFLNAALTSSQTKFIILQRLNPLIHTGEGENQGKLATLSWKEVESTIRDSLALSHGSEEGTASSTDIFGPLANGLPVVEGDNADDKKFAKLSEGLVPTSLALVFLGIDEGDLAENSLPGDLASKDGTSNTPAGVPYFALSVSHRGPPPSSSSSSSSSSHDQVNVHVPVEALEQSLLKDGKYDFVDTRSLAQAGTWDLHDAAVVAQARSLIDWNERHQFCPACSRRQYSLWAGWKRACASGLGSARAGSSFAKPLLVDGKSFEEDGKGVCITTSTLSNFSYPRTDPTVIMAIVSPDGESILLGRQKKWPKGFYSCLAGFLEPGESLEEAVRREVHEESGVLVGKVTYHSSQPWPFPANLMMGAIGHAIEGKDTIRLDLDNELEDARFFSKQEVLAAIEGSANWVLTKKDLGNIDENVAAQQKQDEEKLRGRKDYDSKDTGSVANVTERTETRSASPSPSRRRRRAAFKIPGQTAIAHVLISSWARGEAHSAPDTLRGRM
ncbi:hypothetical protein CBS101457_005636 [Exobasidium rhododendri]|nr:hypothetical protein CBS101457_005636 [Exobasidium rhododendri]